MRRIVFNIVLPILVLFAAVSCKKPISMFLQGGELRVIQLGYMSEVEGSDRDFENGDLLEGESFIAFFDTTAKLNAMERATYGIDETFGNDRNRLELRSNEFELNIKTYPEDVAVNEIKITSSDPSVLEIVSVKGTSVFVRMHKLGDADVKLVVACDKNVMEAVYAIRIYTPINMNFYITPYWIQGLAGTKLRYKVVNMPPGEKELITEVLDSVTVIGYCQYYDVREDNRLHVSRDTVTFSLQDRVDRFRKNKRKVVRNISSAMDYFNDKKTEGAVYEKDEETGEYVTSVRDFSWNVETIHLDFMVYSDNPYLDFYFHSKCDRTVSTYDEEGDFLSEYIDDGGDESDSRELEKSEKNYFEVALNNFMSDAERDSLSRSLAKELDKLGYHPSMSDEEKDNALNEINKHKKKGDE